MKIYRKLIFILIFTSLLAGCEKEGASPYRYKYILAGQKNNGVLVKDYVPDLNITMVNFSVNGKPTTEFYGRLTLDIDLNGTDDFDFCSRSGVGRSNSGELVLENWCSVYSCFNNNVVEINKIPKQLNDTIDNRLVWNKISTLGGFF